MNLYIIRKIKTIQSINRAAKTKKGTFHYERIEEEFFYSTIEKAKEGLTRQYNEAQVWADECNGNEDREQEKYKNYSVALSLVEMTDKQHDGFLLYNRHIAFANATNCQCINGIRWEE